MRVFANGRNFGTVLCARSINPFEGGRWRLRQMRASGCTDLTAMGIESFFVCSLLILLGLRKSEKSKKIAVKSTILRHGSGANRKLKTCRRGAHPEVKPKNRVGKSLVGKKLGPSWVQNRLMSSRRHDNSRGNALLWLVRILWLANCYFSLAAGHVTLFHFVLGLARIELVVADSKGIGAG
jgi:hypothetical protein